MRTQLTLAALAIFATALASGCASRGYKQSEHLSGEIRGTVAAVHSYGTTRQGAFDSMNALVAEPLENLPARFETFNASVDRVVSADGSLRGALANMKSSGNARFKEWGEENVSYADNDMQVQAQKNRAEAAEAFQKAVQDADAMLVESAGFVTYLSDLRKVLSNDLTANGVATIADFASKARVSNGMLEGMIRPTCVSLGAAADAMTSRTAATAAK